MTNIMAAIALGQEIASIAQYVLSVIGPALLEKRDLTAEELAGVEARADASDERSDGLDELSDTIKLPVADDSPKAA